MSHVSHPCPSASLYQPLHLTKLRPCASPVLCSYDEQRRQLWKPLELSSAKRFSALGAYKYIYACFVNDPNLESLYKIHRYDNPSHCQDFKI